MNVTFVDERTDPLPVDTYTRRLVEGVLIGERVPPGAEVAVTLVDSDAMAELNERHMGKTGPTDVLSFPLEDLTPGSPPASDANGPPVALGDVVICPGHVARNAQAAGTDVADEMALMVAHGLLHLLGYDHVDDAEAELMESKERHYLAEVGRRRP